MGRTRTPATKATVEVIGGARFVVSLMGDGQGNHVAEAVNDKTGERFVVRSENIDDAVIELAERVGIELRDA